MAGKRDGLYKRGRKWWHWDPVTGKRETTGLTDREAARRYRASRERLAADPAHATAQTARLEEWCRRLIALKENAGAAKPTLGVYRTKLGHALRIMGPDVRLSDVDPDRVDAYVRDRRKEGVTDHTISKEVTALMTVLKLAKRGRAYGGDLAVLRPPDLHAGYKPRKRALSRAELVALLGELKPSLASLVAICVSLGCRLSEAYRLAPGDIDLEAGVVHIRGTKTDESDRVVPILSVFRRLAEMGASGLPLGEEPNNLRRDISAAAKRAGIANCTPNDFRRTHATILSEAGVDRDVTRRLLGHTTTRLVDTVYGQPSTSALAALAEERLRGSAAIGADNGNGSGFWLGDRGAEGGREGLPAGLEREGNVAGAAGPDPEPVKHVAAVHFDEDGGQSHRALAREPDGHALGGLGNRESGVKSSDRDDALAPVPVARLQDADPIELAQPCHNAAGASDDEAGIGLKKAECRLSSVVEQRFRKPDATADEEGSNAVRPGLSRVDADESGPLQSTDGTAPSHRPGLSRCSPGAWALGLAISSLGRGR